MPAPTADQLYQAVDGRLPNRTLPSKDSPHSAAWSVPRHPKWVQFLHAFCDDFSRAWQLWNDAMMGGLNIVQGQGIGAWVGTGQGGVLIQLAPMSFTIEWPYRPHRFVEWEQSVVQALQERFTLFASTYRFILVNYPGTTTATPITPGTFTVQRNAPIAIQVAGQGVNPSPIKEEVLSSLEGKGWRPRHYLSNQSAILDAIDGAVAELWEWYLNNTLFMNNSATGPSAAVTGFGENTSLNDGKLV